MGGGHQNRPLRSEHRLDESHRQGSPFLGISGGVHLVDQDQAPWPEPLEDAFHLEHMS